MFNVLLAPNKFDIMNSTVKSNVLLLKQFAKRQRLESTTAAIKRSGQQQMTRFFYPKKSTDVSKDT